LAKTEALPKTSIPNGYGRSYLGREVRIHLDGVDATGETSADTLFSSFHPENVDLNLSSRQNGAFHNQLDRASTSVPLNIAEGNASRTQQDLSVRS
jgi:hypothetical protein